jgi:riboflavin synthase
MWFSAPAGVLRYMVPKGSVAVDGVSLTVVDASEQDFEVMIIPHTLETTTLGTLAPGDDVNVEIDVMAKYAEKLMPATPPRPR